MVDSETIIAPRTDSSASRFWGGTMVFPLVDTDPLSRRATSAERPSLHSSLDTRPADPRLPRGGTKSARAWLDNHTRPERAGEFGLFASLTPSPRRRSS